MAGYEGIFSHCKLWSAWMMLALGLGVMLPAMVLRLILYYRVFILKSSGTGQDNILVKHARVYWPFYILWSPLLCACIVAEILPGNQTIDYVDIGGAHVCMMAPAMSYFVISYYCFLALLACALYIRMRSVAKVFNEFKLGLWIVATFLINCTLDLAVVFTGSAKFAWGRIVPTILYLLTYNGYFWLIIGPPIFNHIFRREAALREIIDIMHEDGILAQQAKLGNVHRDLYGLNTASVATRRLSKEASNVPFDQSAHLDSIQTGSFPYSQIQTDSHTSTSLGSIATAEDKEHRHII
ncbi:hypothetical protein DL89DRAFT_315556 [Linderina pennispora]|uniref:G-protein coupled receptors family 1 profile domain-containing protein n=1 Tax=Linderina pennispora TaxID=61395 RepID=A0A1Y1WBG7_9FUNG|nr:uncharacterized protein DL89DRAFT_315556 [Linderina pennispora]ORX70873.1 hypothetical protein DL89DRAFT_315556 [Linderina pennispora]